MKDTIKVVVKEPFCRYEVREMKNTLKAFQDLVGGPIETVGALSGGGVIICNEEGRIMGLPVNFAFDSMFAGTVALVGVDGEEFTDAPEFVLRMLEG